MKVTDFIQNAEKTLFSYEIIPPMRGGNAADIFKLVDQLMPYDPPFIDLTSRSAEVYYEKKTDGTDRKHIKRKRPGTIGLSAAIKNRYNVETVPHILCNGFTKEETEDALIELSYLGIDNVLAVRGDDLRKDPSNGNGRSRNRYASDLVEQITQLNRGQYLEELRDSSPTNFCIGVGGYPETHIDSENVESDMEFLKKKVDKGADYIVTQMFFNNPAYFDFVQRARNTGITVPIIPGIKILTLESHLEIIPDIFHIDIPGELQDKVRGKSKSEIKTAGIDWAMKQVQELVDAEVPCVHFYIMSSAKAVTEIVSQF
ncbi:MAG: methylenetetrahydrofolate reductase [Candidatus Marinimicrobia bacterium]|nr:methylenetetrahydrofolate reductase [Candidatus Neomarinimicrobiota bacterium]